MFDDIDWVRLGWSPEVWAAMTTDWLMQDLNHKLRILLEDRDEMPRVRIALPPLFFVYASSQIISTSVGTLTLLGYLNTRNIFATAGYPTRIMRAWQ